MRQLILKNIFGISLISILIFYFFSVSTRTPEIKSLQAFETVQKSDGWNFSDKNVRLLLDSPKASLPKEVPQKEIHTRLVAQEKKENEFNEISPIFLSILNSDRSFNLEKKSKLDLSPYTFLFFPDSTNATVSEKKNLDQNIMDQLLRWKD